MRRILCILLTLALAMISPLILAQDAVYLRAVEPSEGRPGQELELILWGSGFGEAREVWVTIGEIEVLDAWIESDEAIMAHVFIPEDAPPGPRPVELVALIEGEEFSAVLEDGFFVLEREGPPPPGRPALYEVAPQEIEQGSEVELTLFGENLTEETEVLIHGGGVEVREIHWADSSRLIVRVEVSADATAGPRLVAVVTEGGRAELPDGLVVIAREATPSPAPTPTPPPPSDGGPSPWVWAGGALLLGALGFTVGRALTLRTRLTWQRTAQLQWQLEATRELPEPKDACTWACKAKATTELLKRWKVTALELTPLPLPSGKTPPTKRVKGEVLGRLTEAAQPQYVLEEEARTRQRIAPVVDALLGEILAWRREGQTPASIRVDARLARDVKGEFELHHCEKTAQGPKWARKLKWKGSLHQPAGKYLGVLRGPAAGEPDFTARAREELEGLLMKLIRSVRFKP